LGLVKLVADNQIKDKGTFVAKYVGESFFLIGEYLAKLQARTLIACNLLALSYNTAERPRKCTRQPRFACHFAKYSPTLILL